MKYKLENYPRILQMLYSKIIPALYQLLTNAHITQTYEHRGTVRAMSSLNWNATISDPPVPGTQPRTRKQIRTVPLEPTREVRASMNVIDRLPLSIFSCHT